MGRIRAMTARVLAVVIALSVVVVAAAWLFQGRLIYLPFGTVGSPAAAGLPDATEVELRTQDGIHLDAWYVPPATASTGAAVLVLPGNAGNRSLRAPLARRLSDAGLAVLLMDYRGYAGNSGRPSESGLTLDARAAHDYLARRHDVERIVVFGESLGAAVAVRLAGETDVHGLVLRSPFTSLADVGRRHYPYLPVRTLLRDRFEVLHAVGRLDVPVVVVAGERDTIVPLEHSRRVGREAGAEVIVIAGADHNDQALATGDRVIEAIVAAAR